MSPIIYITLSYVFGVFAQKFLSIPILLLVILSGVSLFVCVLFLSNNKSFLAALLLLTFLLGAFSLSVRPPSEIDHLAVHPKGPFITITNRLNAVCQKMLPSPYSNLLGSLVLGSSASPPPPYMKEAYRKVGTIHLLVASGQQISILFGFLMAFARMLNLSPRDSALVASGFGGLFSIIAGAGPSIIRAFIMSEMTLLAPLLGREAEPASTLSFSALVLLLCDPRLLFDIGFQLSFAATFSLLYLAPVVEGLFCGRMPKALSSVLSISIAPFLLTMPIIAYNFSQLSLVSILANALVIFWIELVVVLGFVAFAVGFIYQPASLIFSGTLFFFLKMLNLVVFFFAGLPFSFTFIKQPTPPLVLCYYILLAGAFIFMKNRSFKLNRQGCVIFLSVLLTLFVWHIASADAPRLAGNLLTVTAIDVGQGDSTLIEPPSGKKVLIDGGQTYSGKYSVVPLLAKKGINRLDVVVLTHPHADHLGGILEVLRSFKVDLVIDSGQPHTSNLYMNFLKLVEGKKIKYKVARAGDKISLGDSVEAFILWPGKKSISGSISDLNNNSVVIRLVYNKFSILLPGDLGFEGEKGLLAMKPDLKSDILKVAHHGSATSTSIAFLSSVRPKAAVISVGENKYKHPSGKTLELLKVKNIKIYRTDLNGNITISTNGDKCYVEAERK